MRVEKQIKSIKNEINKLYKQKFENGLTSIELAEARKKNDEQVNKLYKEMYDLEMIASVLKNLKDPVIAIIRSVLNMSVGENFKRQVTFQELINYKIDDQNRFSRENKDNKKFAQYVGFIEELQAELKFIYPFIDLSEIDLSWTTNQLLDYILDAYFTIPSISVTKVQSIREQYNTESIAEDIVKNMFKEKKR